MTTDQPTPPTSEAIETVARWLVSPSAVDDTPTLRVIAAANRLLTSTDPDVHAALAASLPDDVMLAELVKRGTLTEDPWSVRCTCGAEFSGQPDVVAAWNREHDDSPNALHIVRWQAPRIRPWTRRLVTAWEVTP
jgi:hypothetical protein